MKPINRKILRMRAEFLRRDRVDVEYGHSVLRRYLLQSSTELDDLPLVFVSHGRWNSRRTRNIREVPHDNSRVRLLFKSTEDLFVIFGKLLQRNTMSDVVNTNANRYEIRIQCHATIQLSPQH